MQQQRRGHARGPLQRLQLSSAPSTLVLLVFSENQTGESPEWPAGCEVSSASLFCWFYKNQAGESPVTHNVPIASAHVQAGPQRTTPLRRSGAHDLIGRSKAIELSTTVGEARDSYSAHMRTEILHGGTVSHLQPSWRRVGIIGRYEHRVPLWRKYTQLGEYTIRNAHTL